MSIPTLGIDISSGDGAVNWQTAKSRGIIWATIRCTWNKNQVDKNYIVNVQGAQAAGIRVISYHFFVPRVDTMAQATWFLSKLLPNTDVMIDLEDYAPGGIYAYHGIWTELLKWMTSVEAGSGKSVIQYTSKAYIDAYLYDRPEINQRPIVLAHWRASQPSFVYPVETGRWFGWQFVGNANGSYYGIEAKEAALYIGNE